MDASQLRLGETTAKAVLGFIKIPITLIIIDVSVILGNSFSRQSSTSYASYDSVHPASLRAVGITMAPSCGFYATFCPFEGWHFCQVLLAGHLGAIDEYYRRDETIALSHGA